MSGNRRDFRYVWISGDTTGYHATWGVGNNDAFHAPTDLTYSSHSPAAYSGAKPNDAAQSVRSTNPRHLLCNSISGIMKSSRLQYGRAGWLPFFYVHFRIESSLPFLCGNLSSVTTLSSIPTTTHLSSWAHYSAVLHVANWFAGNKICRAYFPSTRLWCIVHIWTRFYKVHSATSKSSNVEK